MASGGHGNDMEGFFFAQKMAEAYFKRFENLFHRSENVAKIAKLSAEAKNDYERKKGKLRKFGFWLPTQIMLAESGIFGKMDEVENANAIDTLTAALYLVERSE